MDINSVLLSSMMLRMVTGIVFGSFVLAVTFWGGWVFTVFVCCLWGVALYEWLQFYPKQSLKFSKQIDWKRILFFSSGFIYLTLFAICFIFLRIDGEFGLIRLLFLYAVVWGTDVGAYFFGRILGGKKLAPSISPGKTWSGAISGVVTAGIFGLSIMIWHGDDRGTVAFSDRISWLIISVILSIIVQIGDLSESRVKRHFGLKDSGWILPGHGGILDRIDGLIPATILFYIFCLIGI